MRLSRRLCQYFVFKNGGNMSLIDYITYSRLRHLGIWRQFIGPIQAVEGGGDGIMG